MNTEQKVEPVNFFDEFLDQPVEVSVAIKVVTDQIVNELTEKINREYLNK